MIFSEPCTCYETREEFHLTSQAKSNCVVLFGGLGNQLHQLALGFFLAGTGPVEFDAGSGDPRQVNGRVAISNYALPFDVNINQVSSSRLRNWIFLSLLKISAKKFRWKSLDTAILFVKDLIGLFRTRKRSIFVTHGVGFDIRVDSSFTNRLLIGTFHSYEWVYQPLVLQKMRSLSMLNEPVWLSKLRSTSTIESPIVVHIRRGDYLAIRELGFLREDYYIKGVSQVATQYPEKPIWIFSDDFNGIADYLPKQFVDRVRYIDFDQENAVANLEAMRLGSVYVLSNSTFSWWAATLSTAIEPVVVCPDRWFRSKPTPSKYIPDSWIQIPV